MNQTPIAPPSCRPIIRIQLSRRWVLCEAGAGVRFERLQEINRHHPAVFERFEPGHEVAAAGGLAGLLLATVTLPAARRPGWGRVKSGVVIHW
jgi:hypothetical protein